MEGTIFGMKKGELFGALTESSESTACGEGLVFSGRLHVAKVAASRFVLLVMVIQIFKYLLWPVRSIPQKVIKRCQRAL